MMEFSVRWTANQWVVQKKNTRKYVFANLMALFCFLFLFIFLLRSIITVFLLFNNLSFPCFLCFVSDFGIHSHWNNWYPEATTTVAHKFIRCSLRIPCQTWWWDGFKVSSASSFAFRNKGKWCVIHSVRQTDLLSCKYVNKDFVRDAGTQPAPWLQHVFHGQRVRQSVLSVVSSRCCAMIRNLCCRHSAAVIFYPFSCNSLRFKIRISCKDSCDSQASEIGAVLMT
jgi:hypothetical protein